MSRPFRWKNCFADILAHQNGRMALSYFQDVVEPSLAILQGRIFDMAHRNDDPAAVFGIGPAKELLRSTVTGYCLALQSLWEQQLRLYLDGCLRELKFDPQITERLPRATWERLDAIFEDVRGVPLSAFEEFRALNLLQLLGNVCRHGHGPSLDRLTREHPELWVREPRPEWPLPPLPPLPGLPIEPARTAAGIELTINLLKTLAAGIDSFWHEAQYIYHESIERKPDALEALLVEERRKRAGRGRPWDPPA